MTQASPHPPTYKLQDYYRQTGAERVGFILTDGRVIEVPNCSQTPDTSFDVSADDLIHYEDHIAASFHTHPGAPSALSSHDMSGFLANPDWIHYIVGNDGVSAYEVNAKGVLVRCADGPLSCMEASENTDNG